ncbi:MAG: aminotransferase class I/II-fold pyridoxal phosphate-dependent enzyme [Desulfobulbaceae bacterium]|nr:aminotransferase class I/II-fold pyridoxal phosphate-dependent enzyme [Desulfobulbaceae bacterium]HIJ79195.1 aminotransferase class I/II-fold pyridoxal phosphate-dependent enzyme [Deltaproteobacteria bacterium]
MVDKNLNGQGVHGGDIISMARRLGCAVDDLIDMSSNLSPFGMLPGLREELIAKIDEIAFLPESGSETLAAIFAAKYGLHSSQVLVGNGTTEFIYAVPQAVDCRRAVIVTPTYADYRFASAWAGLEVVDFPLRAEHDFRFDFERLAATLTGGELVFICNPNNPTSGMVPTRELYDFALARPGSTFLIDESYLPFVREESMAGLSLPDNIYVLNSSSKIYGIPGLRLGFLVSSAKNMRRLAERRKPWGVNRMAQVAGEYLLGQGDDYVRKIQDFLVENRPGFVKSLAALPGVSVVPGAANFILCRLNGSVTAMQLREAMLKEKIMIRDCHNFVNLDPYYFRVSLKDSERNRRCLAVLKNVLEDLG